MIQDYYQLLRISPNATAAEIRKAFRREAKKVHPDLYQGRNTQEQQKQQKLFILLTQGYEILMDPERRQKYDDDYKKTYGKERQEGQQKTQPNTSHSSGQKTQSSAKFQRSASWDFTSNEEETIDSLLHDVENLLARFGLTFKDPLELLVEWARRVFHSLTETWDEDPSPSPGKSSSKFSHHSQESLFEDIEAELKNLKQRYGKAHQSTPSPKSGEPSQKTAEIYVEIEKELGRLKKKYRP